MRIANGDSLVTGFDIVNGFKLGNAGPTTDGTDKLDLAKTQIAANTSGSGVDGVDKGVIHSHQIVNGLITFNEVSHHFIRKPC